MVEKVKLAEREESPFHANFTGKLTSFTFICRMLVPKSSAAQRHRYAHLNIFLNFIQLL
jgi:hypothetical protein